MSENRVIGRKNDLPWHIPEDLEYFKKKTKGSIIIMGRKTFDSIKRPLPKRLNIVITRDVSFKAPGTVCVKSLEDALEHAHAEVKAGNWPDEIFIVGGAEIYRLSLPYLDRIYLTEIHAVVEGDTFFPPFNTNDFVEIDRQPCLGQPAFDFVVYQKVSGS